MIRIEHSETIARPQEEVFAYLADPTNQRQWQSSVSDVRVEGPLAVGSRWVEVRTFMGRSEEQEVEVVELQPPSRFTVQTLSGAIRFRFQHQLSPANGGTRLDLVGEGEAAGFAKIAGPLAKRKVNKELTADFGRLKQLLESRG
jgi:carbon monoxide dehydrogenase subunit G